MRKVFLEGLGWIACGKQVNHQSRGKQKLAERARMGSVREGVVRLGEAGRLARAGSLPRELFHDG